MKLERTVSSSFLGILLRNGDLVRVLVKFKVPDNASCLGGITDYRGFGELLLGNRMKS